MQDKYNYQYVGEALMGFVDSIMKSELFAKLEVRPSGEFARFSLRDGVRLSGMVQADPNGEDTIELEDKIARQLLTKTSVSFWKDDVQAGTLSTITDASQSLESDPFLLDNPVFYKMLLDVATGYVLKNFTAPLKSTPVQPAQ